MFDLATLNDGFAQQVDWSPLEKGGINICIHGLLLVSEMRYEFKVKIGASLFAAGIRVRQKWFCPRVFDLSYGYYWRGRIKSGAEGKELHGEECPLLDIYTVLVISEYCSSGTNNSYYSYELNLVLKNGTRLNVVDHGNKATMLGDAKSLAEF